MLCIDHRFFYCIRDIHHVCSCLCNDYYSCTNSLRTTYLYVLLSTNATQILPIDSEKYDAVEIKYVSEQAQTITISPVSGKITQTVYAQFNVQKEPKPAQHGRNLILTRYWPEGLSVHGKLQCQTILGEETQLVWNGRQSLKANNRYKT